MEIVTANPDFITKLVAIGVEAPETLTIGLTFCWIASGGGLGGLLAFLTQFNYESSRKKVAYGIHSADLSKGQFTALALIALLLGIGGALAVQFTLVSVGQYQTIRTVDSQLFLFTVSVIAGYGGRQFLQIVTDKMEEKLKEKLKVEEATETSRRAAETSHRAEENSKETSLLIGAVATLNNNSNETKQFEIAEQIEVLENQLLDDPKDRRFAILLGRLYRKNKQLEKGIKALTTFINHKKQDNERDRDYADALYNRACYLTLIPKDTTEHENNLLNKALNDLDESIKITKGNAKDAIDDADFDTIKENKLFKELTEK